jgi:hypothetical protein
VAFASKKLEYKKLDLIIQKHIKQYNSLLLEGMSNPTFYYLMQ